MGTAKSYRLSNTGIRVVETRLNELERDISYSRGRSHLRQQQRDLQNMSDAIIGVANRLSVFCTCVPQTRRTGAMLKKLHPQAYSGATLDLSGNCRDKAGKFVPVRNCTGRGPATKRKPKKKAKRR